MAISDRITSIEEHIKESYQELEGIGIDTTGVNKNLENIPKLIDGYWETLPKVTGEGTSITLDNTKEGKMKIVLKGNTSQETTTQSKNLMPNEAESQTINGLTITKGTDGSLLINGTSTATTKIVLGITNLASGTYTLSTHKEGTVDNSCYLRTVDTTTESEISGTSFNIYSSNSKTYTLSENKRVQFDFYTGGNRTFTNFKIYPMAESGSTATDYVEFVPNSPSPDYPQDIHVVSGNNSIKVEGKNLFDKDNAEQIKDWFVSNNKIEARNSTTLFFIKCEPSTQYTISKISSTRLQFWCSVEKPALNVPTSGALNDDYNFTGTTKTITTTSDAQWLICYYYNANSDTKTEQEIRNSIQIEKGNQATTYETYTGASYPINLGTLELCKIGDYQDYIYKDNGKWYKYGAIGKVVLDGTNESFTGTYGATNYGFAFTKIISNLGPKPPGSYSNNFKFVYDGYVNMPLYSMGGWSGSAKTFTFILDSSIENIPGANNWLSAHNTIVYYILATPTTEEITDTTLISQLEALSGAKSYNSQTNISQESNDLASLLNATALEEM